MSTSHGGAEFVTPVADEAPGDTLVTFNVSRDGKSKVSGGADFATPVADEASGGTLVMPTLTETKDVQHTWRCRIRDLCRR